MTTHPQRGTRGRPTTTPTPAAQLISKYDRHQLDVITHLNDPARPLIAFDTSARICRTEPAPGRGLFHLTCLQIVADLPAPTTEAVISLLDLDVIASDRRVQVLDRDDQPRTGWVLRLTQRGRALHHAITTQRDTRGAGTRDES
jgi:hypothetical protein